MSAMPITVGSADSGAETLISALQQALGHRAGACRDDDSTLENYARDEAMFTAAGRPIAVVFPETTAEVQGICRAATEHGVPIVARGAGTGLAGAANAVEGGIVVSFERMNRVIEVSQADRLAVVQPGVINADLRSAVAEVGLFYPPDPSSYEMSTLGGNVATNAGGLCCVKYGVTRDYVLGLEVVLADGRVMRTGRRSVKGVAGLDLTALFVGSEGILGLITEITLRLRSDPGPARITALAEFPSVAGSVAGVQAVMSGPTVPSLLEIMDRTTLDAVSQWRALDLEPTTQAVVLLQSDSGGQPDTSQLTAYTHALETAGATAVYATADAKEAADLVAVRRMAGAALSRLGAVFVDDIALPMSGLAEFIEAVTALGAERKALVAVQGHAGDGNLHPSVIFDPADEHARATAYEVFEEIARLGLALGGTLTGEHGVGLLKRELLAAELGPVGIWANTAVKRALDPDGLLNPGKVLPAPPRDEVAR